MLYHSQLQEPDTLVLNVIGAPVDFLISDDGDIIELPHSDEFDADELTQIGFRSSEPLELNWV